MLKERHIDACGFSAREMGFREHNKRNVSTFIITVICVQSGSFPRNFPITAKFQKSLPTLSLGARCFAMILLLMVFRYFFSDSASALSFKEKL